MFPKMFTLKRSERVPWCEEHSNGGVFAQCLACVCRDLTRALAAIDDALNGQHEPDENWFTQYDIDLDENDVVKRVKERLAQLTRPTVVIKRPLRPGDIFMTGTDPTRWRVVSVDKRYCFGSLVSCDNATVCTPLHLVRHEDGSPAYEHAVELPHRPQELLDELNKCALTGDKLSVYVPVSPQTYMRMVDILKELTSTK